jgi:hypothetical protein
MTADLPDDACNPRHELEALERAHLLIANEAAARILDHQSEIDRLRAVQFEHRAAAKQIRALAETLPEGGEVSPRLTSAIREVLTLEIAV